MYRYKRKRRGATLISRVLAVARKMSPISRAFAETKGKMGGGRRGWKRRQKFPSRSSWRNMSETKAATESQLAKQRARNAMPEKARGRWGRRERELVKRKKKGWWIVGGFLGGLLLQFLPLSSPFNIPSSPLHFSLLFRGRKQGAEEEEGLVRGLRFIYLDRTLLFAPRLGTLSSRLYFFNGRHGWDFLWLSRIEWTPVVVRIMCTLTGQNFQMRKK